MIVFAGIAVVTLFFYYMLGRFLNRMIWGESTLTKKSFEVIRTNLCIYLSMF